MTDVGAELARMRKDIERLQRAARLSYASLDDTALEVRDGNGSLRGVFGQQGDGTTAVNVVNGPTPPTPTPPTVTPALAGLTVSWGGSFADSVAAPLDWMRCEIHIGGTADFTPSQSTLRDTIESPQGGMVTIPLPYTEWNIKLRSRTSSGSTSAATAAVAATPRKAATADLTAGIITADLIAVDALNGKTINGGTITGGTVTGSTVQTATTGKRIALLPDGTMALYSGRTGGETPGSLESGINSDGSGMQLGYLVLKPPTHGPTPPEITMAIGPVGEQQWSLGPLGLLAEGSNGYANVFGDLNVTGRADISGVLTAGNIRAGRVSISAGGGTPTSMTVTGLGLTGATPRAVATPSTQGPGTTVTGVGCTGVSTSSITVWVTRLGTTTTTGIDYIVIGN